MRPALTGILRCLLCRGNQFDLSVRDRDDIEIVSGSVACRRCGLAYGIEAGILDALPVVDTAVAAARTAYRAAKASQRIGDLPPGQLALREHLDHTYRKDTEANFRDLIARLPTGTGWALDIGAGTCWTTAGLVGKGYAGVAIDISADNKLELGRHHFSDGIFFDRVLADVNRLPFRDAAFSLSFASAVLHHSRDLNRSLVEIARVVTAGGGLELINEPVKGLLEALQQKAGKLEAEDGVIEKQYGLTTWRRLLHEAGFDGIALFPANIRQRLAGNGFDRSHKFHGLTGPLSRINSSPWGRAILEELLFYPGLLLLGLPLIYSGKKRSPPARAWGT
ncbi:MAG: methyltransferase domain-containing protein [Candidatus Edwardsbacteria bacterium]|nr:methyltransferase domain-containing protein [Candidatus Edwardsbacteria bacterium]